MKKQLKMTKEEWRLEGKRRFGSDQFKWRFKRPSCGHVASAQEWKDAGAKSTAVAFSCVGRWTGAKGEIFDKNGGPCNYAGGGLFGLNPVTVEYGGHPVDDPTFFSILHNPKKKISSSKSEPSDNDLQSLAIRLCEADGHDPHRLTYHTIEMGVQEPYGDMWTHYLPQARAAYDWLSPLPVSGENLREAAQTLLDTLFDDGCGQVFIMKGMRRAHTEAVRGLRQALKDTGQ